MSMFNKENNMTDKQKAAFEQIQKGIEERGLDITFTETMDGSKLVLTNDNFPTIHIGKQGGIFVPDVRSYKDPLECAINADKYLEKQNGRDVKKAENAAKATEQKAAAEAVVASAEAAAAAALPEVEGEVEGEEEEETENAEQAEEAGEGDAVGL